SISSEFNIACFYVDGSQLIGNPLNPNCTASTEELSDQKISIYPNPTDGLFYIDFDQLAELQEIYLLDVSGKRIAQLDVKNLENGYDISSLPKGMYIVEIVLKQGTIHSKLLR
ncbi:MAG: T9SS type A sorting domain-containing protein, partial [Crocinitomicaceae bacterium]